MTVSKSLYFSHLLAMPWISRNFRNLFAKVKRDQHGITFFFALQHSLWLLSKTVSPTFEPRHEKTGILHMRKLRRRSAAQLHQRLCFRYIKNTDPLLSKCNISSP